MNTEEIWSWSHAEDGHLTPFPFPWCLKYSDSIFFLLMLQLSKIVFRENVGQKMVESSPEAQCTRQRTAKKYEK